MVPKVTTSTATARTNTQRKIAQNRSQKLIEQTEELFNQASSRYTLVNQVIKQARRSSLWGAEKPVISAIDFLSTKNN